SRRAHHPWSGRSRVHSHRSLGLSSRFLLSLMCTGPTAISTADAIGGWSAAAGGRPSSLIGLARNGAADGDDDAGADKARDEIADPATERNADHAEDQTGDHGADNPQHDVHPQPGIAFHELLGEPSGDTANDDGRQPTYTVKLHLLLLREESRQGKPATAAAKRKHAGESAPRVGLSGG